MPQAANIPPCLFPSRASARMVRPSPAPEVTWWPITPDSILLCLDPSIARCGWAIVKNTRPDPTRIDSGILCPVQNGERSRFDHLSDLIRHRIELATAAGTPPEDALIEVPAGGQRSGHHVAALMIYARSIGICESTCHRLGLNVNRVTVTGWKGTGKKSRTELIVKHCFQYEPRDSNEADALGMALWLCAKTKRTST